MALARRLLRVLGAAVALLLYVWFAAVRAVPSVRRRKARRRAAGRA